MGIGKNRKQTFDVKIKKFVNFQLKNRRKRLKMPKYYCDYCDTYLTHDSPSVRKTHCAGRKHKENVKFYYQKWMEEQAQSLIDATTAAFKAGKLPGGVPGPGGVSIPPPMNMRTGMPGPPPGMPGMPPGMGPPPGMPPHPMMGPPRPGMGPPMGPPMGGPMGPRPGMVPHPGMR